MTLTHRLTALATALLLAACANTHPPSSAPAADTPPAPTPAITAALPAAPTSAALVPTRERAAGLLEDALRPG